MMACAEKFGAGAVRNILRHNRREIEHSSNHDIDPKRLERDYILSPDRGMTEYDYFLQRKSELYCYNRNDVKVILMLVAKYHDSNCEDKEILVDIRKAVDSSMQLRSKKDLIENFIATVNTATKVDDDWIKFVTEQKKTDLDTLIVEEKLKPDETRKFVDNSFRDGVLKTTGTDVDRILPPVSRFGGGNRTAKKDGIIAKLQAFFDKYFGLI